MPGTACRFHETFLKGYRALTIENEILAVTLLPEKGADIYSLVYKPQKLDVLWKSPWGLKGHGAVPSAGVGDSESVWFDHYEGGWQEIFPNGGDACFYRGAPLTFHGEASISAWDYTIRQETASRITVEFRTVLCRSPFHLRRCVTVERSLPAVLIEETIENRGEEDLHFMWGHHPAFGSPFLDGGSRLVTPAHRFLAHDSEISPACRLPAGASGTWPMVNGKNGQAVDLSLLPPTAERVTEFGYLSDFSEGWYALLSAERNLGFGMAWPTKIFPYLWFWQELRGSLGYPWYGRCYVMAVQPFTSIPGIGLSNAIEQRTAPVLQAGGKIEAQLAAVFFESRDVRTITTEGAVR